MTPFSLRQDVKPRKPVKLSKDLRDPNDLSRPQCSFVRRGVEAQSLERRSGQKLVTLPNTATGIPRLWHGELTPLQRALARGHRWLAMLESGVVKSLREIAKKERVDSSYVSRTVNLTTLAPDIGAAILDETLPLDVTLFDLAVDPATLWEEQRRIGMRL